MNKYLFKFLAVAAMIFSYYTFIEWRKENPISLDAFDFVMPLILSGIIVAGDIFWDWRDAKKKKMES